MQCRGHQSAFNEALRSIDIKFVQAGVGLVAMLHYRCGGSGGLGPSGLTTLPI